MHARFIAVMLFTVGCSSAKQPAATSGNGASVRPIDASLATDAAVDAAIDAAAPPAPVDAAVKAPHVKAKPKQARKPCPACGIGCPHGVPSSKVDENGCSVCACEDFAPIAPKQ
jgi:hypothetical protein